MLRELAETSNAVQSNEIFDMAEEQGISKRTLENAKKELGIRAKKINNSWYWELDKIKQISEELFIELLKYHLVEIDDVLPEIKKGLEEKLEAMVKRDLYTKYKTAPTEEEREKARQEYLEKVGMHRSFRW